MYFPKRLLLLLRNVQALPGKETRTDVDVRERTHENERINEDNKELQKETHISPLPKASMTGLESNTRLSIFSTVC